MPFILIPLYIYPFEEAWEPLFRAARVHPNLHFVVVINPNNGPGQSKMPDACYTAALRSLADYPNICTLGYVYCSYGKRPISAVRADIDTYYGWSVPLAPRGVFIDEAPADETYVDYLASLTGHAKAAGKSCLGKVAIVVYNPGVVVGRAFFISPDYVVVLEASIDQWSNLSAAGQALATMDAASSRSAVVIVHSAPDERWQEDEFWQRISYLDVAGIYVTDQHGGGYTRWPAAWSEFTEVASKQGNRD